MARRATAEKITISPPPNWVAAMIGNTYGRLCVISAVGYMLQKSRYYVECKCSCGNTCLKRAEHVKTGVVISCDCYRREQHSAKTKIHGETPYNGSKSKMINAWMSMKARCFNKNNAAYKNYGGRGITMCDGLRYSYLYFKEQLGVPEDKSLTIDRVDNDKNYSCGGCLQCKQNGWGRNVRWADRFTQANNKRNNVVGYFDGQLMTAAQAVRKIGERYGTDFIQKFKEGKYNKSAKNL